MPQKRTRGKRKQTYRKKKVYNGKKRMYRKYKPNIRNTVTIHAHPIPQKMFTQLVCVTSNGLIDALLSFNSKVYRPTSYFDLDPDVGGPTFGGYNTFAAIYSRYRVLAFKYTIAWVNLQSDGVLVSAQAIPSTATPSELSEATEPAIENEYGQWRLLGPTAAGNPVYMKGYVNCTKIWGTPEVKTESAWAGSVGGSPSANTWLRLGATRINNSAISTGVQFTLRIKSYGYWDQRTDLTT